MHASPQTSVAPALIIKKLVLGITGGIAAYKAAELVRLLVKAGIEVQVVMTEAACQFITPVTMQALSGKLVSIEMWDQSIANGMPHIELSREADAILIAPASANFIAKLVHGCADDLLSTLCLARDCPLIVAPAMNKQMWENPATQRNITQLGSDGVTIWGPAAGEQACGEVGLGRMLEPEEIIQALTALQQPELFAGKHILITAGATVENFDPVRGITNFSSGKMGFAVAQAAAEMGAEVTLIAGKCTVASPKNCKVISATSALTMHQAVMQQIADTDIFISVAAVADYRPANPRAQKIKKTSAPLNIELVANPDILSEVASLPNPPFCVGFAAESERVVEYAREKMLRKKLPMIVANHSNVMGEDHSQITIIDDDGEHPLAPATKQELARLLLKHIYSVI
jgi:phosphopantothenoylcysteine decarboxylase/phosphopantothenate--cysteine ligase